MNKEQLRGKTIFDIEKDRKLLEKILGDLSETEAWYKENGHTWFGKQGIARNIIKYAEKTSNQELLKAAKALLKTLEKEWEQHRQEAWKKGILLD